MTSVEINVMNQRELIPISDPKSRVIWKNKSASSTGYYILEEMIPAFSVDIAKTMFTTGVEYQRPLVYRSINYQSVYVYLLGLSANLILRNAVGQFFIVAPNSIGIMQATTTTYSDPLRTSDLNVGTTMFGFIRPSGTRQVFITDNIVRNKSVTDSSLTSYFSTSLAFDYGSGPVFMQGSICYRLIVTNSKAVASQRL